MTLRCSEAARDAGLPIAGSAPRATSWLIIEQRIPFGARALLSDRLDPRLREVLARVDATVLLARRTRSAADPERFWYADLSPGGAFVSGSVTALVDALHAGRDAVTAADALPPEPALFLCTNGSRDQCCAIESRVLLEQLRDLDSVWECSHIGGHRFAPTALLLPSGYVYGRLTEAAARDALSEARAGRVSVAGARGRACLAPAQQVADIRVRELLDKCGPATLAVATIDEDGTTATVSVTHTDGRVWQAALSAHESQPVSEGCGKQPQSLRYWLVDSLSQTA